jgi:RecA/RadA recombinase
MAAKRDLTDSLIAKIKASAPKKGAASGGIDIGRTSKLVLSQVNFVLNTGVEPFDDVIGGLAFGRVVEVYGPESCGKTQMAIRIAGRAQQGHIYRVVRKGGVKSLEKVDMENAEVVVLYVDNEGSLDDDQKISVDGVPLDVAATRCDTVDHLFKMVDKTLETIDQAKAQDVKDKIEKEYFVVIVVDTIACTSSKEEMTQEFGKDDYNRQAKQLRQGFRTLMRDINRYNVLMVCTNQVSDNFKASAQGGNRSTLPQDDNFVTFGGKALKFASTQRIFMFRTNAKYKLHKKEQFESGFMVGFKATKNRLRPPMREGRLALLFAEDDGGFHNVFSKLETLIHLRAAEIPEGSTAISFRFRKFDVPMTTFSDQAPSLEAQDEAETPAEPKGRGKAAAAPKPKRVVDPSIDHRIEWLKFYTDHKADCDALYTAAINKALTVSVGDLQDIVDDGSDEEGVEDAED